MSSTRLRLIQLLSDQKDNYISGQLLSRELGISRSAVWKHMNELKKDGYEIDARANKGYRIVQNPQKLSENTVLWGLKTNWLGKRIIHRTSIPTTQRIAHELALDGAEHGTIVLADEQTKGQGRAERSWHAKKGRAILLSMILRPEILPYMAPQLTLLTATVIAGVIEKYIGVKPQIKWPNDILINGKKIAGILTEMQAEQDQVRYVIIGIGMNVNQLQGELPEWDKGKASSLRIETGKEWELPPLVQHILYAFELKYQAFLKHGFDPIKTSWENYGFRMRETLQIKTGAKMYEAIFLGIAEDGALLAQKPNGSIERIYSAEISWFEGENKDVKRC